jgi:hypothetical protein
MAAATGCSAELSGRFESAQGPLTTPDVGSNGGNQAGGGDPLPPWPEPALQAEWQLNTLDAKYPQLVPNATGIELFSLSLANDPSRGPVVDDTQHVVHWSWKSDAAQGSPDVARTQLPMATRGGVDYFSPAVGRGPGGALFMALATESETIDIYRQDANGWQKVGGVVVGSFAAFARVAVASDGKVFVFWNATERLWYVTSSDGGASWSAPNAVPGARCSYIASVDTDAAGHVIAAFPGLPLDSGDGGRIYVSQWNGMEFVTEEPVSKPDVSHFASPTVSIGPEGTLHLAWRDMERPPEGQRQGAKHTFYATKTVGGTWQHVKLATSSDPQTSVCAEAVGTVAVVTDPSGTVHAAWAASNGLCYASKTAAAGSAWTALKHFDSGHWLSNATIDVTTDERLYVHVAVEDFIDEGSEFAAIHTRYYRFVADR